MSKSILIVPGLIFLVVTILAEGGSCRTKDSAAKKMKPENLENLAKGVWGGEHIRVEVTDKGATIEFDCAAGVIEHAIVLDSRKRFEVDGKFSTQHPGPVLRDEESSARVVHYLGDLKDGALSLTIVDPKTNENLGDFTLTLGNEGHIRPCR